MSTQNSLQVASGDAIEEVTNTPANNKKCSTKSMLLLGTGAVYVVVGIAMGAYHAGTDTQKSAANLALDSAKEKIEGMFGDDEEPQAMYDGGVIQTERYPNLTSGAKSGKSASSKSKKKSSGTASPTTDILKAKSSKSGVVTTSSPSTDSLPDGGGSSKSSKSDGGTSSPTTDMLSGKSGDAKSSKSGVVTTSSPSTDGLTTSSPTDFLPAGGLGYAGELDIFNIEKDEEKAAADSALLLSQAEYSMSMFTRRQYN